MGAISSDELRQLVQSSGQQLQSRTSEKLAVMHKAFLIAADEARAQSPVATIDFATMIRIAGGLGVRLTYQHVNARALWPNTLRLTLFSQAIGHMEGRIEIVVEHVRVDGGHNAMLRALTFGPKARVIDCRVGAAGLASQQSMAAALLRPFEVHWLSERGVTVLDGTSGYPINGHPLLNLAEHVEVVARIQPNDLSPRPRRAGAVPAQRHTVAAVIHMSSEGLEEVGGPGERHEIVTFAGGCPKVPVLCRPKVRIKPGESAGAARKTRARVLAEQAWWLSQDRYEVDRSVSGIFSARENAIALQNLELLTRALSPVSERVMHTPDGGPCRW
jgi:hypothetical protein